MKKTTLLIAGLLLSLNLSAAVPPPEKLLPGNTFAVLTVPDTANLRDAFGDSSIAKMWADPAMKAFATKIEAGIDEHVLKPLRENAGFEPTDYLELAQGQITFALTDSLFEKNLPGFLLLVDSRKKADALETKLGEMREKLQENDQPFAKRQIRGVEFTVIKPGGEDEPEVLIGLSDTLLIAGINDKDVEKVLVAQAGGDVKPLGSQPSYMRRHNAQFRKALVFGWLDFATVMEKVQEELEKGAGNDPDEADNPLAITPDAVITALGLKGLNAISTSYHRDNGDIIEIAIDAPKAERRGLFKMLAAPSQEAGPPAFAGDNVITFSRMRYDIKKVWADLEKMLEDITPQAKMALGLVEQAIQAQDPKFRLKEDFINTLGDDIINIGWAPEKNDLQSLASPPSVTLIKSEKPKDTLASILTITSLALPAPEKKEFLGRTIHTFEFGGGFDEQQAPASFHLSAADGYLVMSGNRKALEDYLRGPNQNQKQLANLKGLKAAAEKIGGMKAGMFGFQNDVATMKIVMETFRENPDLLKAMADAFPGIPVPNDGPGPGGLSDVDLDWLDFKLLPAFEKVRKYFHFTIYNMTTDDKGMRIRAFSPTPPELE